MIENYVIHLHNHTCFEEFPSWDSKDVLDPWCLIELIAGPIFHEGGKAIQEV